MPVDNPAGVAIVGPSAPYITPETLRNAVTGIAWSTIPFPRATAEQQLAEQLNICVRATAQIDTYCNQPLRATVDTEMLTGPGGYRCQLEPSGVARLLMSQSPVTVVVSGRVASAGTFPRAWTNIPADQFEPERPLIGVYGSTAPSSSAGGGQAILLAPGWVTWSFGRLGNRIQVVYVNGWPHASLTADAPAGAASLTVDDITAWDGAAGVVYDTGGTQEFVAATAVTPTIPGAIAGPGVLTLSAPTSFDHDKGTIVSSLPGNVQLAAIFLGVAQALTRGATATAVQVVGGGTVGAGASSATDYIKVAQDLVHAFQRVI
jgi:hypothetical protein